MTVSELSNKLASMPQDYDVAIYDVVDGNAYKIINVYQDEYNIVRLEMDYDITLLEPDAVPEVQ